jgi:hypothetical protein
LVGIVVGFSPRPLCSSSGSYLERKGIWWDIKFMVIFL